MPRPRLVATIGMHASASTWVFNVVREMMVAGLGEAAVVAAYADDLEQLPDEAARNGRHLVLKSHHGSAALDHWIAARQGLILLSMRDPRDAVVSMAQRFKSPLNHAATWIAKDCNRLVRLAAQGHPLLRYEDRFFAHSVTAESLARMLSLPLDEVTIKAVTKRYSTEAVRSFAQRLSELPHDRVTMVGSSHRMDQVTQIHEPHIGDTSSGKWRNLPEPLGTELTRMFTPFLDRFGYPI